MIFPDVRVLGKASETLLKPVLALVGEPGIAPEYVQRVHVGGGRFGDFREDLQYDLRVDWVRTKVRVLPLAGGAPIHTAI